jgi:hypothetical protein
MKMIEILMCRGDVLLPANVPLAALAVALSYAGGFLRWNKAFRRLEIVLPFDGIGVRS